MSSKTATRPPDTGAPRRRVSFSDRVALRIGMSLIIWSRRTRRVHPVIDHETRLQLDRERQQLENDLLLQAALMRAWR